MAKKYNLKRQYVHKNGFILLTTIVMVSLLAFLVLSLMQGVFLYSKTSAQLVSNHQEFYQMETVAYQLAFRQEWFSVPDCIVENSGWNRMENALEKSHCRIVLEGKDYHYLIEDLGEYPAFCILTGSKMAGSHHWLLNVINHQGDLLQLRIAKTSVSQLCDSSSEQTIEEGVISWRYLRHS
ncbi:hypothetical protein [Legionella nagasakiensis]|uniref:hypothetical protein n=1 Tax=Legionella nagasakiensis TaxID=535290 RepID=UPI00105474FF|nr:hypothetical protein [Legionella nagasakiensis]